MKLGKFILEYLFEANIRVYDSDSETELYTGRAEDTPLSLSQRKISFVSPNFDKGKGAILEVILEDLNILV